VVIGAGAAAFSCASFYINLGVKREHVWMLDSKGLLTTKRTDLNKYKLQFVQDSDLTSLEEVIKGADVFLGLSKGNILTKEMVKPWLPTPLFLPWQTRYLKLVTMMLFQPARHNFLPPVEAIIPTR
jgi:malate dehydrogenase (oxaloacetate-decarboxylating)(NADP+)